MERSEKKRAALGVVTGISKLTDIPARLRDLAQRVEDGEFPLETGCTVLIDAEVFHFGPVDDKRALLEAVFNMNDGIYKLMRVVRNEEDDG